MPSQTSPQKDDHKPLVKQKYVSRKKRRLLVPRLIKDVTRERLAYWCCYGSVACLATTVWTSTVSWSTVLNRLAYFQLVQGFNGEAMPYVVGIGSSVLGLWFFFGSFLCLWATATDYRVKFYRILQIYLCGLMAAVVVVTMMLSLVVVYRCTVNQLFQGDMLLTMRGYANGNQFEKMTFDRAQIDMKCCGSSNYTEWWQIGNTNDHVPFSCCNPRYPGPCRFRSMRTTDPTSETVYRQGCRAALRDYFTTAVANSLIAPLSITLPILVALLIAFRYLETSVGSVRDEPRMDSPSVGYLWIRTTKYQALKSEEPDDLYEEVEEPDDDDDDDDSSSSSDSDDDALEKKTKNANKSNDAAMTSLNSAINVNMSAAKMSSSSIDPRREPRLSAGLIDGRRRVARTGPVSLIHRELPKAGPPLTIPVIRKSQPIERNTDAKEMPALIMSHRASSNGTGSLTEERDSSDTWSTLSCATVEGYGKRRAPWTATNGERKLLSSPDSSSQSLEDKCEALSSVASTGSTKLRNDSPVVSSQSSAVSRRPRTVAGQHVDRSASSWIANADRPVVVDHSSHQTEQKPFRHQEPNPQRDMSADCRRAENARGTAAVADSSTITLNKMSESDRRIFRRDQVHLRVHGSYTSPDDEVRQFSLHQHQSPCDSGTAIRVSHQQHPHVPRRSIGQNSDKVDDHCRMTDDNKNGQSHADFSHNRGAIGVGRAPNKPSFDAPSNHDPSGSVAARVLADSRLKTSTEPDATRELHHRQQNSHRRLDVKTPSTVQYFERLPTTSSSSQPSKSVSNIARDIEKQLSGFVGSSTSRVLPVVSMTLVSNDAASWWSSDANHNAIDNDDDDDDADDDFFKSSDASISSIVDTSLVGSDRLQPATTCNVNNSSAAITNRGSGSALGGNRDNHRRSTDFNEKVGSRVMDRRSMTGNCQVADVDTSEDRHRHRVGVPFLPLPLLPSPSSRYRHVERSPVHRGIRKSNVHRNDQ